LDTLLDEATASSLLQALVDQGDPPPASTTNGARERERLEGIFDRKTPPVRMPDRARRWLKS
jgi:hypothetical protein